MNINVPRVTGRLRENTLALTAGVDKVAGRAFELLAALDASYSNLPHTLKQDVLDSMTYSARLWFESLLSGTFPSAETLRPVAEMARRRVHQGISLASLMRAVRIGSRELWLSHLAEAEAHPEVRDEMLFVVTRYLMEHFDVMTQTITEAYLDEQHQRTRWRDALRYELCNIVFSFPQDTTGFRKASEGLGLDSTVPRTAIAQELDPDPSSESRLEGELDRQLAVMARHLKVAPEELIRVVHRGRLIVWTPCVRGDTVAGGDRRVADSLLTLLKAMPEIQAMGIGLMNEGPAGWAQSAEEALKALDTGKRANTGRVHLYSDIAVNESVRRTDNVLRYLHSLLERLSGEPELLSTLAAYFGQQQRRRNTAEQLGIHPNTLNNRLERIEALLGAGLDDARWIAKLHVAVELWKQSRGGDSSLPD